MSAGRQLLAPTLYDKDNMGTHTTVYQVERFGAQSPSHPMQLLGLLEYRDTPAMTTTTSSDSNPDIVFHSNEFQSSPPGAIYKG